MFKYRSCRAHTETRNIFVIQGERAVDLVKELAILKLEELASAVVMDALLIARYVRVTYVRRKSVFEIVVPGGEEWYSWKIN